MDDLQSNEENESVGELSTVSSQIVLKCLCLAGTLWSVNKLALILQEVSKTQKSTSGVLCVFGSHTFVPLSWMCKKQISVSHSSTEAELISLDAGLLMDGTHDLSLSLWDLVIEIFHSVPNKIEQPKRELRKNLLQATKPNMHNLIPTQAHQRHFNLH